MVGSLARLLAFDGSFCGVRGSSVDFVVFDTPFGLGDWTMDEPLTGMVVDLEVLACAGRVARIRLADSGEKAIRKIAKSWIHILKSFCLL
jgi:hypothetical protein